MIVSALSFYDPAQASTIPDYSNPRWDTSFEPSFSDNLHNPLNPRDSAFHTLPGNNSGTVSTRNDNLLHHEAPFGSHRTGTFSRSSQLYPLPPSQSQHQGIQHRQVVPIPRRQRGLGLHHAAEAQSQVQTHSLTSRQGQGQGQLEQEQRGVESQVRLLRRRLLPSM